MRSVKFSCRWLLLCIVVASPTLAFTTATRAQVKALRARTTWDSVYTPEQAARGESTYTRTCSRCHQPSLGGADEAVALTGGAFMASWDGQTLQDLHDRVRTTMPSDTPGTYSRKDISDVLAYMLKFNQFPAGAVELPLGDEDLKAITFVSGKP